MDFSKFKTSDWLKVGGGVGFLIFGFFKWFGADCDGDDFCEQFLGDVGVNAWDFTFSGIFAFLLLAAVAVLTFLAAAGIFKLPSNVPAPLVFLAASGLATLMVVLRFLNADGASRKIGLFLCLAAAIAVLAGSILGFKESGGDLSDLKDVDKLKGAFQNAGGSVPPPPPGMTPPPPPPGMAPPPPPPPPPSGMAPPPPPPPA